jgi:drug/metabolite transporter (DMT)-like permease
LGTDPKQQGARRLKTWAFAALVVLSNAFGNLFLDFGVHGSFAWLVAGVLLLILWMLSRMTLLSWADLSFVLPVTAVGYVLSALFGFLFLGETVSAQRWLGTLLIFAGVALVGRTGESTEIRK